MRKYWIVIFGYYLPRSTTGEPKFVTVRYHRRFPRAGSCDPVLVDALARAASKSCPVAAWLFLIKRKRIVNVFFQLITLTRRDLHFSEIRSAHQDHHFMRDPVPSSAIDEPPQPFCQLRKQPSQVNRYLHSPRASQQRWRSTHTTKTRSRR